MADRMAEERFAIVEDGRARILCVPSERIEPIQGAAPADGAYVVWSPEGCQVLAEAGSAKSKLYALAASRGLDPTFSEEVRKEVDQWRRDPGIDDPSLEDLTEMPFVTIDGPTSKDLDQALVVERDGDGFVVWYALADPSYFAQPGSALFAEALRRGASFYLPGLMVPMLPEALSEGLVSLNPGVDRRAMVFVMRVDATGKCFDTELKHARVRSRAKLAFGQVQSFYDGDETALDTGFAEGAQAERAAVETSLGALAEVGLLRDRRASERGVVRYRRVEVAVKLGDQGHRFVILQDVRRPVERYNEQVSLLCNVEGAKLLRGAMLADALVDADEGRPDARIEPIFRVHPPPPANRLEMFEKILVALAERHGLDSRRWCWTRGQDLGAFLDALPTEGPEGRIARAIHRQAVILNTRSTFGPEPGGHHGVGADVYARFSAPMREIVGVYLHMETWQALGTKTADDPALRAQVVERANESKRVQRSLTDQSNRLVLDQLFEGATESDRFFGTVMGLNRGKVYVLLDQPPIDVKIYLGHQEKFSGGELSIDESGTELLDDTTSVCRLGDRVDVVVRGRDEKRDRWILTVATKERS